VTASPPAKKNNGWVALTCAELPLGHGRRALQGTEHGTGASETTALALCEGRPAVPGVSR